MRNAVICDMKGYVKNHWRLIAMSVAATLISFGFLVFTDNIRIDTKELLNHPGTTDGWLAGGILFFWFFLLGANLLTFGIYHFSKNKQKYPYWVFLLLYVTSNIWSFQVYFSLQQAEVAFAMLLMIIAALLSMRVWFVASGKSNIARIAVSTLFLVVGLGAYQALAVFYIAICIMYFLLLLEHLDSEGYIAGKDIVNGKTAGKSCGRNVWYGLLGLIVQFGVAYVLYRVIADAWLMTTADYMENQMGWGRLSVLECVKNVLRTAKNLLFGDGPRNFSFFTIGVLVAVWLVFLLCRQQKCGKGAWSGLRFRLFLLALLGLLASPFLMTIYMGEMLVTRSQFALPVASAFLGTYGIGMVYELWDADGAFVNVRTGERLLAVLRLCVLLTIAVQTGYNLRLAYTDEVRQKWDEQKTKELLVTLQEMNDGVLPAQPVIFVGYQKPVLGDICRRTEMYGWSFYEWDYSEANPTGATHGIAGFVQAYAGEKLNATATEEERQRALEMAESMTDFPQNGSVQMTDDFVVVRLSEVVERTDYDWW